MRMRLRRLLFYLLSCGAALFTAAVWYDRLSMAHYRSLTLPITNLSFDIQAYRSISGASEVVLIHPQLSSTKDYTVDDQDNPFNLKISKQSTPKYSNQGNRTSNAFDSSNHRKAKLDSSSKYNSHKSPDNPSNDTNHRSSKTRDAWKIEQARRQAKLQKACAGWKKSHPDVLSASRDKLFQLLVDDKHQAIYCYVPKVSCTNWKRLWMILTGLSNETDPLNIPEELPHESQNAMKLIHQNNPKQLTEMKLQKYKKFMVVRDPYERLLSAFRNKLEHPGKEYFQKIVDHIRKARLWEFQHGEGNITFPEFVRYVNSLKRGQFEQHWKPYSLSCFPCAIHYDVIGKYETLVKDSERFLRMIGAPQDLHFPPYWPGNTSTLLPKYLAQLSPRQLTKLSKVYKDDLEAFDYQPWSPQDVGLM